MLHKGLDFHVVRSVCHNCGWYRNVAHSGCADGKRALVRIESSNDSSHVIDADVIEIPDALPISEWKKDYPNHHDLVAEAHDKGLIKTMRQYSHHFEGKHCPRCKKSGQLQLEQLCNLGEHARY